jgi:hypothetical protein
MLLLAIGLVSGCASNAPYYKQRKQKGCDCPKWNALPAKPHGSVSAQAHNNSVREIRVAVAIVEKKKNDPS